MSGLRKIASRLGKGNSISPMPRPERLSKSALTPPPARNYTAAFDEYAKGIQRIGLRNSGRYVGISTGTAIEEAVFGPLARSGGIQ